MARSAPRRVVYLIGTSGHPNYGDEVITAGWLRYYAEHMPDAEVWLDSQRPGQSAVLFSGLHPSLRCVDTLYHACWNAPSERPDDVLAFGRRVVGEPGLIPREAAGIDVLLSADLIHVLGGGFLNSMWPRHYAVLGAAAEVIARTGAVGVMTGAGLFPAENAQESLAEALSDFAVVDVRDEESHALLVGRLPQLTRTGDDAFMALAGTPINRAPQPRTVLCLQEDLVSADTDTLADYVVRTLQAWGVDRDPVLLLECLPPNDLHITDRLAARLPALVTMPFSTLWSSGFPVARNQRWISTRFHPHLLAAAAGVWGVAVPTVDYYRVKHQSLVDLGSGWAVAESLDEPVEPGSVTGPPYHGELPAIQRAKQATAASVLAALSR